MAVTKIPTFYRVLFLYVDPLLNLAGIYSFFFDHSTYIQSAAPAVVLKDASLTPLVRWLLFTLGSYSLAILAMQVYLLQEFKDAPNGLNVKIWRFVQAAILLVDLGMSWTLWDALGGSGTSIGEWAVGEWANVGVIGPLVILRSAFVLGLGI